MYKTFFLKSLVIALTITAVISCDSDSNDLGADIIGDNDFEAGIPEIFSVNAMNQSLGPVETSDLPVNTFGIYNNPVFGQTTATVAIQAQLAVLNPTIDPALHQDIESVVLSIPYYCTKKSTDSDGDSIYELDSIYGPSLSKIKLRVYESKYFIRSIDPTSPTQEAQKYYSNQRSEFDALKGEWLNDGASSENDQFVFSPAEHKEVTTSSAGVETTTRTAPAMRLNLNKDFFKRIIFDAAADGKLLNNSVFKEHFRGLYFSVENAGADAGNLAMMNFKGGSITIKYKQDGVVTATDPTPDRVDKSIVLSLSGKSVNFLENASGPVQDPDRLYLKGGEGSMTVIDLFGRDANGNSPELDNLRAKKWLVNDASLTFQIDNTLMGNTVYEPNRIYLYDLDNKRPLVDYYTDQTSASNNKYAKYTFGGIIKKKNDRGAEYKIRLTNHIRALLKNADSTNVRLGLVVTESIALVTNKKLKTEIPTFGIKDAALGSVLNPLGTILYGSNPALPEDKRIKFKIYFTKPKN